MADTYVYNNAALLVGSTNASNSSIASAVTLPDIEEPSANHAKGVKRRMSSSPGDDNELEQESKRQRMSPGKNSPAAARDEDATSNSMAPDTEPKDHPRDAREDRRKSSVADEKQRSKRLFGALLGSLNQPKDRTTKRRQEIESRRKAELKRQDDERVEDKQRRQERLREQRTKAQVRVEEEQVRCSCTHINADCDADLLLRCTSGITTCSIERTICRLCPSRKS